MRDAPYADESATKNVSIHTATSSKSIFSRVHALLDIYSVDTECHAKYAGTVNLDRPSVAIGIAADRWSYLVFDFGSSSFCAGTHATNHDCSSNRKPIIATRLKLLTTTRSTMWFLVKGNHEVHCASCPWMRAPVGRTDRGARVIFRQCRRTASLYVT